MMWKVGGICRGTNLLLSKFSIPNSHSRNKSYFIFPSCLRKVNPSLILNLHLFFPLILCYHYYLVPYLWLLLLITLPSLLLMSQFQSSNNHLLLSICTHIWFFFFFFPITNLKMFPTVEINSYNQTSCLSI